MYNKSKIQLNECNKNNCDLFIYRWEKIIYMLKQIHRYTKTTRDVWYEDTDVLCIISDLLVYID